MAFLALIFAAGCSAFVGTGPVVADQRDIDALAHSIMQLGPDVDPDEARRAAQIAFDRTHELAVAYQIEDPPLVHNTKVNMGTKPRGLCWHWAEDMETRLDAEGFETLEMQRAIASADNPFRIDHSTAIISAKDDSLYDGIVLDPWRMGGTLFWAPTLDDTKYDWVAREKVLADKRARLVARGELPGT